MSVPRILGPVLRPMFPRRPEGLDRTIDRFGLPDPWLRERVRAIVSAFLTGYNAAASARRLDNVHSALSTLPRFFRPFAYEGAAMGYGPWALLNGGDYRRFEELIGALSPRTVYQNYVGLGWWLAMRPRVARPSLGAVLDLFDHHYRLLPMEGLGFRAGFLGAGRVSVTRRFDRYEPDQTHVCYQGYGRSLWFVHMGQPEKAGRVIDALAPAYHGDCYSGLGLGCAYSWLDRADRFDEMLARIPTRHADDFLQGAAFGWEARQLADRPLFDELTGGLPAHQRERVEEAVRLVHLAKRELDNRGHRARFYQAWRELTRQHIAAGSIVRGRIPEEEVT